MKDYPTIAVLIPLMDRYYQCDLWRGIKSEAEKLGYNLIFFCGSNLDSPINSEKENNIIYNLPNVETIDGYICVSGTMANYSGADRFLEFINRFEGKPMVHISLEFPGSDSVLIDNYGSMNRLMKHVMTRHHYQKYAYFSGPETNLEATKRHQAFTDVMKDYGILENQVVVFEGDFSKESGMRGVDYLWDDLGFIPEIIICANDEMAIGVHTALTKRRVKMPDEVAFTGFDNAETSTTFLPAFTTVNQPLAKIGKASVNNLHQLMTGRQQHIGEAIPGEVIVRESCGCFNFLSDSFLIDQEVEEENREWSMAMDERPYHFIIEEVFKKHFDELMLVLDPNETGALEQQARELLERLYDELEGLVPKGSFLKDYYKLNHRSVESEEVVSNWVVVIEWMREKLHKYGLLGRSDHMREIFFNGVNILGNLTIRNERKDIYDFMGMYYYSSELIMQLNQVKEKDQLFEVLIPYLRTYKFDNFYVCLFDDVIGYDREAEHTYPDYVTMTLGFKDGKRLESSRFKTEQMLPADLDNSELEMTSVIYPLFFRELHFGYLVCDTDVILKPIFRTIKEQIANTLERLMVYDQLEQSNQLLEEMSKKDSLTDVLNRRGIYDYIDELVRLDQKEIGIVLGDVDGLKAINDQFGHTEGDYAIKQIVSILESVLGTDGLIGRWGGDEFMCVIKEGDRKLEEDFIEAVKSQLADYNQRVDRGYTLGMSMGYTKWQPHSDVSLDAVILKSDQKLYMNKMNKTE